jgi:hypothetical protein
VYINSRREQLGTTKMILNLNEILQIVWFAHAVNEIDIGSKTCTLWLTILLSHDYIGNVYDFASIADLIASHDTLASPNSIFALGM